MLTKIGRTKRHDANMADFDEVNYNQVTKNSKVQNDCY